MQIKDLLKPHQLDTLKSMTTTVSKPVVKTLNKGNGKKPIPQSIQPNVIVKRHRHIDKGNT